MDFYAMKIMELLNVKVGPAGAFREIGRLRCVARALLAEREELLDGLRKIKRATKGLPKRDSRPSRKSDGSIEKLRKIRIIAKNRLKLMEGSTNGNPVQESSL